MKLLISAPGLQGLPDTLRRCFSSNCGIEVDLSNPDELLSVDPEALGAIETLVRNKGIHLSAHGPYHSYTIASKDSRINSYFLNLTRIALEFASRLGAKTFVLHTGFVPCIYSSVFQQWLSRFTENFHLVCEKAAGLGVKVLLENVWEDSPERFRRIFEPVRSTGAGFCLDVAHNELYQKAPLPEWLDVFGDDLAEVHLSEPLNYEDVHAALGSGVIDWDNVFKTLEAYSLHVPFVLSMDAEFVEASLQFLGDRYGVVE